MGINYRKKVLLKEEITKRCETCKMIYSDDKLFCPKCGKSLKREKMQIFANMGKNGLTSFTYKLPDGTTINSKGNVTIPIAKGMSYTTNTNKKKSS